MSIYKKEGEQSPKYMSTKGVWGHASPRKLLLVGSGAFLGTL